MGTQLAFDSVRVTVRDVFLRVSLQQTIVEDLYFVLRVTCKKPVELFLWTSPATRRALPSEDNGESLS